MTTPIVRVRCAFHQIAAFQMIHDMDGRGAIHIKRDTELSLGERALGFDQFEGSENPWMEAERGKDLGGRFTNPPGCLIQEKPNATRGPKAASGVSFLHLPTAGASALRQARAASSTIGIIRSGPKTSTNRPSGRAAFMAVFRDGREDASTPPPTTTTWGHARAMIAIASSSVKAPKPS
jgi:hypothetical protein